MEETKPERTYEAMWVCPVSRHREDAVKVTEHIGEMVERAGGNVLNCVKWDERRLAYPINDVNHKKHRRAMYCLSHFKAGPDSITRLERLAKLSDNVLRVLIIKDEDGEEVVFPENMEPVGRQRRHQHESRRGGSPRIAPEEENKQAGESPGEENNSKTRND